MSGSFGGYCPSDRPKPRCACGMTMTHHEAVYLGRCQECEAWERERRNRGLVKLKACRACGHPFYAYRDDQGCCSQPCRQTWLLREYHSERAQRWFVEGWGWLVLDVMQQVYQELYPSPMIAEVPAKQLPMWNTAMFSVDGKSPASRAKGRARPPRRDNAVNAFTQRGLGDDFEDQNEAAWDREDARMGRR